MCKISIVMPVYNEERYLKESILSMLNQSFQDFEFIILDDGSTDNSVEIVRNFMEKDSRIKLIRSKRNCGLIKTLNKGIRLAKGRYIARMDADDISLLERLKVQYQFLEARPDIFLIGSAIILIDQSGKVLGKREVITGSKRIERNLKNKNCIIHPSIMFRNQKIVEYREKALYCEDYDLYLQLLCLGKKLDNIPLVLLKYRIHNQSVTSLKKFYQKKFVKKIRQIYLKKVRWGIDEYDSFDPNKISSIEAREDLEKQFARKYILSYYNLSGLNKIFVIRNRCRDYFKKYGFLNRILIYYLISFLPIKIIKMMKKIYRG